MAESPPLPEHVSAYSLFEFGSNVLIYQRVSGGVLRNDRMDSPSPAENWQEADGEGFPP